MEKHATDVNVTETDEGSALEWERFVTEELSSLPRQKFPECLRPKLTQRQAFGEVGLIDSAGTRSLLAAMVVQKSQNIGDDDNQIRVLSAAAAPGMMGKEKWRHLAFWKQPGDENVFLLAVYETDNGAVQVLEQKLQF